MAQNTSTLQDGCAASQLRAVETLGNAIVDHFYCQSLASSRCASSFFFDLLCCGIVSSAALFSVCHTGRLF